MRLTTFSAEGMPAHVGVILDDDTVADLSSDNAGPASMLQLLRQPDWARGVAALLVGAPRRPLAHVKLHAPVPVPPKYFAIGLNAPDHRRDINLRWLMREPRLVRIAAGYLLAHPRPKHPFFFTKATSSVTGPFDRIILPPNTSQVDWEGELAVMVGTPLLEADVATARRGIAGYLIANDVSVRDWQTDNPTSPGLAKSYPSHGPLGPWLVTADDLDLTNVELRTYLNGALRQRGRIANLLRSPAEILSTLSGFCALHPGDVVACGTFSGTGWPAGRFLQPGDTVRIEIDGIGHIANPVTAAPP